MHMRDNTPTDFIQEALQVLQGQSSNFTRRSAGIPAILAGLLIPSTVEDFTEVTHMLMSLAREEEALSSSTELDEHPRLPQVHAMNCLREIFTRSEERR